MGTGSISLVAQLEEHMHLLAWSPVSEFYSNQNFSLLIFLLQFDAQQKIKSKGG